MLFFCLTSLVAGILPMLVYALVLWWIDHWEREPLWLVGGAFLWGAVPAIVASLIFQLVAQVALFGVLPSPEEAGAQSQSVIFMTVVAAPLTEEFFKALALVVLFLFFRHEIDSLFDGLVYGAIVGFGFAAVENVGYFLSFGKSPGDLVVLILLRAFAFGPMHALFTGMTGLGFAAARFQRNVPLRVVLPLAGLAAAMFLHAAHNALATAGGAWLLVSFVAQWAGVFWILALLVASLVRQRNTMVEQLQEEVALGVLTADQATRAASFGALALHMFLPFLDWFAPGGGLRRLTMLAADLSFKKHQLERMDEPGTRLAVDRLRAQLHEASQRTPAA